MRNIIYFNTLANQVIFSLFISDFWGDTRLRIYATIRP